MGFRDKLKDFKERLSDRHMYSIILVIMAVITGVGIYQYKRGLDYRNSVENQYNRAFQEVVGYVDNIEVSLAKSMLATNSRQMVDLSSEIWRKAAFAQANLGQIPISQIQLDKTSRFLTQVGDYTYNLSRRSMDGQPITDEEFSQIEELHKYSISLRDSLREIQNELYSGRLQFGRLVNVSEKQLAKADKNIALDGISNIEKEFQEYPALIYDGPFSDHIEDIEPKLLQNGAEITEEQARDVLIEFLGEDKAKNIKSTGETNGSIPAYQFLMTLEGQGKDDGRKITAEVTKINGHIVWMLDNRLVENIELDIEGAKSKVKEFLESKGINNMKESYYMTNGGIATINYAYVQDGIVMYPDLVKVKVALDNGEIVGFESKGYIM